MRFPLAATYTPLALHALALIGGVVALALASRIAVPMVPVPITGQTFAVTLIGALYGARLGTLTVLAWLAAAALGLPLLADGGAGLDRFTGPTGGYLLAFPFATALVGHLAERGACARFIAAVATMLAGNALCLALGTAWLASLKGLAIALDAGLWPFLPGAALKSLAAAAIAARLTRA